MSTTQDVITIDCHYIQPRFAASYLIIEGDRALFIENNTAHAIPYLLQSLKSHGLAPEQVEYCIITHVHLDHAGGSSALLEACPDAVLLTHPRAARHVIDPSRLIQSAISVYGREAFYKLYGEIKPIKESRVRTMDDNESINWGNRQLQFIHTRGHANHHFCVYDSGSEGIFTGDSFGLGYPDLQKGKTFLFPSSAPTDFNPEEASISIKKILSTNAKIAFLTHYGPFVNLEECAQQLQSGIDYLKNLIVRLAESTDTEEKNLQFCTNEIKKHFHTEMERSGIKFTEKDWQLLNMDIDINASGIVFSARRMKR